MKELSTQPAAPPGAQARVLVLMAAYNGGPWIAEQLDSVLAQEGVTVHIVVRDDCSSDDTRSIVAGYPPEKVTLHTNSERSGSAAQNYFGLIAAESAARYDYVALCDNDDVWFADKLRRAATALVRGQQAGYSGATLAVWPDGRQRLQRQSAATTAADFLFEGAGQGCTFVLTRTFYQRARDFIIANRDLLRSVHYHDWTIYAVARMWDERWYFDSEPTMQYRQHGGNDTGAKFSLNGIGRRLQLISSGWYARQIRSMVHVCLVAGSGVSAGAGRAAVQRFNNLLALPGGLRRRLQLAAFCARHGRRRGADNAVLVLAALSGKI